jgi:hypothetical protein
MFAMTEEAAVGSLALLLSAIFLLPVLAYALERRLVWPYGEIGEDDPGAPAAMAYHVLVADHAKALGFAGAGAYRDLKGRLYRVRYEFWLSPERDVLAMVGAGTVARIPVAATWLFTPLADGRAVVSVDQQSGMEPAPGDPWDWGLRMLTELPELLDWHRERVAAQFTRVEPFEAAGPRALATMARLRSGRIATFARRGIARYRDAAETSWSYTATGAVRVTLRTYAKGFRDALIQPVQAFFRSLHRGRAKGGDGRTDDRL